MQPLITNADTGLPLSSCYPAVLLQKATVNHKKCLFDPFALNDLHKHSGHAEHAGQHGGPPCPLKFAV